MEHLTSSWAVADAKAHFSEVLRNAREHGAQRIGTLKPCILISEEEWLRLNGAQPVLGEWLVKNLTGLGEIDLPDRADPPRESLFSEE